MRNKRPGLVERLTEYKETDVYPFHMPGHKRRALKEWTEKFSDPFSIDITEIEGFDNLHRPEGLLKESMEWASEVYGSDKTYYLINGSSCGILSAICGTVSEGGTLLMSRNCHKSAYHGVFLKNLDATYIYPQIIPEFGLQGGLKPKDIREMLTTHPEIQAVLVVSPTYDGIVSDIGAIAGVVHEFGRPLLVDEAHGAHFPYGKEGGFPVSALELGADVVVQSLHKTLPSFTQTAVLHVKHGLVNCQSIERYLQIFESSSPSYVLMAAMESCIQWMDGEGRLNMLAFGERIKALRRELAGLKNLKLLTDSKVGKWNIYDMDASKIIISTRGTGITGKMLSDRLRSEYHLEMEMCGPDYVTAITTLMDTEEGLQRLCRAFKEIDSELVKNGICPEAGLWQENHGDGRNAFQESESKFTIAQAMNGKGHKVFLEESVGQISKEFVYLYPPGIPIVAPGEVLRQDLVDLIQKYRRLGLPVQGLGDESLTEIEVMERTE